QDLQRRRRRRPPRTDPSERLRLRRAVLGHDRTPPGERVRGERQRNQRRRRQEDGRRPRQDRRDDSRLPGLELDLPSELGVPPRLHRQPPEPLVRDQEQRAVPPPP